MRKTYEKNLFCNPKFLKCDIIWRPWRNLPVDWRAEKKFKCELLQHNLITSHLRNIAMVHSVLVHCWIIYLMYNYI